jgi:nucleoside-diphosphate-sugar epimerase
VIEADLLDCEAVRKLFAGVKPSVTFNLAGYGVDSSERDEVISYQVNRDLIESICKAVAEVKDVRWPGQDLIHAGSALEYGAIDGNLSEDSVPKPTCFYGRSKLAGTLKLARCSESFRLKTLTARLFTVYGPGEHAARLLPSLIEARRRDDGLEMTSGEQKRDFTYVEDVAEGLLRLGLAAANPGEVVNLATGRLTSVRAFAESAATVLGLDPTRLEFGKLPIRGEEMKHSDVSIKRLRQLTGWTPTTAISEGIEKTLSFYTAGRFQNDGISVNP